MASDSLCEEQLLVTEAAILRVNFGEIAQMVVSGEFSVCMRMFVYMPMGRNRIQAQ